MSEDHFDKWDRIWKEFDDDESRLWRWLFAAFAVAALIFLFSIPFLVRL